VECRRAAIGHPKVLPGPLGPAEGVWANMKNGLGNVAVRDVTQLAAVVKNRLKSIQYRPELICVTGTAPIAESGGTAAPGDVYAQSVRCLDIDEQALQEAGASLADVIRTRVMLTDINRLREAARAHAQRFAQVRPACTFEVSRFIDPEWLVEFEVDAIVPD